MWIAYWIVAFGGVVGVLAWALRSAEDNDVLNMVCVISPHIGGPKSEIDVDICY